MGAKDAPAKDAAAVGGAADASLTKRLTAAAERALAEAAARRAATAAQPQPPHAKEVNGPAGPDPVRYGDWEVKGIASDF
jgi:hypothetical protein